MIDELALVSAASGAAPWLPEDIRRALDEFRARGNRTGFLLIRAPIGEVPPPTPPSSACHVGEGTALAEVQAIVNQWLGEMVAYEAEGGGRLFQDMVPCAAMKGTQTSLGSDVALEIHTEQAFSEDGVRPDALSLACLRGDPDARTYVLHVRRILEEVTAEEAALMREPLWTVGVDASFLASAKGVRGGPRGPVPILSGPSDDPTLVFDQDLMRGVTGCAEALRLKIVGIYERRKEQHVLAPGDILLVDNRRAVHGRSAYAPRFDGTDRFVVRSFVSYDLGKSEHARGLGDQARTVLAAFS